MESDLVLNWTDSFSFSFVKMTEIERFRNPKNQFEDQIRGS
jgi:hypothetical protein